MQADYQIVSLEIMYWFVGLALIISIGIVNNIDMVEFIDIVNLVNYIFPDDKTTIEKDTADIFSQSVKMPKLPQHAIDVVSAAGGATVKVVKSNGLVLIEKIFEDKQVERYYQIPNGATLYAIISN